MINEAPGRQRAQFPDGQRGQFPDRRRPGNRLANTLLDSGRGMVIFLVGIFFLIAHRLGIAFAVDDLYRYCFSGLCILYGGWRIYRGYKQNYN
jgi:hypothetical protein